MATVPHKHKQSTHMLTIIEALYSLTYKNYDSASQYNAHYARLIGADLKGYYEHTVPYAKHKKARRGPLKTYANLRGEASSDSMLPYASGRFDLYQAEGIKFLLQVRSSQGRTISGVLLSKWLGVNLGIIRYIKQDQKLRPRKCTMFDLRTDLTVLGSPRAPTKVRTRLLEERSYNLTEHRLKRTTLRRANWIATP